MATAVLSVTSSSKLKVKNENSKKRAGPDFALTVAVETCNQAPLLDSRDF